MMNATNLNMWTPAVAMIEHIVENFGLRKQFGDGQPWGSMVSSQLQFSLSFVLAVQNITLSFPALASVPPVRWLPPQLNMQFQHESNDFTVSQKLSNCLASPQDRLTPSGV